MKKSLLFFLLILFLLAACSSSGAIESNLNSGGSPTNNTSEPEPTPVGTGNADVLFVRAKQAEDGTWTFEVTVAHPDTGWMDYADGWDVVLPEGKVAKTAAGGPYTRLLTHPHEEEQPFTRSQSGILVPDGVTTITVRAHDLVDGFGGQEVVVDLEKASGPNFEVETPLSGATSFNTGLTYLQPDGNRYIPAGIDLAQILPSTISLPGLPAWIVGIEDGRVLRWLVAMQDGQLHQIERVGDLLSQTRLGDKLPAGMPPVLASEEIGGILSINTAEEAPFTHPVITESGTLASLTAGGDLVLATGGNQTTVAINALTDSRILTNGTGQFLVLTGPTAEYTHSVLGDGLEAKSATMVSETAEIIGKFHAPVDMVFEAIQPIWADIDQDGDRDVVLTASNAQQGAQILVYNSSGQIIARSKPIGTGYRWRNQAAVAPFGPNGELELVNVITPHLLGKVEFLQLNGEQLDRVAEVSGYTSHVIGTRNLDMFLSADLDADGLAEILLPTQDLTALGIIKHKAGGAELLSEIPLDGRLSTNLAGIKISNGLAIAAGTENGTIYLWLP